VKLIAPAVLATVKVGVVPVWVIAEPTEAQLVPEMVPWTCRVAETPDTEPKVSTWITPLLGRLKIPGMGPVAVAMPIGCGVIVLNPPYIL